MSDDLLLFDTVALHRLKDLESGESLFNTAMDVGDCSLATRDAYLQDLNRFSRFLEAIVGVKGTGLDALEALCTLDEGRAVHVTSRFRTWMREQGMAPNTIARSLRALNSITGSLRMAGKLRWNLKLRAPRGRRRSKVKGPGDDAWAAIIEQVSGPDPTSVRDRAMFLLMGCNSLRASEVCAINISHVDASDRSVLVQGKGDKQRTAHLGEAPWEALEAQLKVRWWQLDTGKTVGDPQHDAALFVSARLHRVTRFLIHDRVKVAASAAGVKTHPHALRHRAGTQGSRVAAEEGIPLAGLQELMGHASLDTTTVYIDDKEEHAAAIGRRLGDKEKERD